jgi:type IV secretion system protein VirD4
MASPAEVATLLGTQRLRRVASIIRPDIERTRTHHRPDSRDLGWQVGRAVQPRTGQELWIPWDRTAGIIGPQGSGKTLDLLVPALLDAPGAALVTLTKVDDLLLTLSARQRDGRPCAVLDPFGLTHGLPELVWDPISGCVDPMAAERRAKAFTAGTIKGAVSGGQGDDAARFYAAEASKVLQSFFHAAALADRNLDDLLVWVAHPRSATEPAEILREHPHAAPFWHGLLQGALKGDERTAANTIATVQQAMALFFQADIRRRCVPSSNRAATDISDLIRNGGTIYLLGREDPYASASPLMTAVAESVLDTALLLANSSSFGRLCPPMLACLDELPSTAPLPTLRTRMANERALGLSFIYASQTWRQLASIFGEQDARALFGLTNVLCLFGGSKDVRFNQEVSDLLGPVRISRHTWQTGTMSGRSSSAEDIPILTGAEVRQLPDRHALVVAENGKPIIARLRRALDGKAGRALDAQRSTLRHQIDSARNLTVPTSARTAAAHAEARRHGLGGAKP